MKVERNRPHRCNPDIQPRDRCLPYEKIDHLINRIVGLKVVKVVEDEPEAYHYNSGEALLA